ncbi:hypothetical protein Osc7112_2622 [Oscillatoria nigro-viridis PCC 7112]|uniref:Uncharacterized protein n=1 Tax=Phormidium nigroviride PCC 7112 TaxID=179408 RepID=K9VGH6_9CYAN|nr:hypothetical protein Osc7112_2622 [Oscillatoria nigro-viridis PCC 7112]
MQADKCEMANLVGNHGRAGFITAFFSVRGGGLCLCSREFIRRGLVFFSPQRRTQACVAANLFAGNIHPNFSFLGA